MKIYINSVFISVNKEILFIKESRNIVSQFPQNIKQIFTVLK